MRLSHELESLFCHGLHFVDINLNYFSESQFMEQLCPRSLTQLCMRLPASKDWYRSRKKYVFTVQSKMYQNDRVVVFYPYWNITPFSYHHYAKFVDALDLWGYFVWFVKCIWIYSIHDVFIDMMKSSPFLSIMHELFYSLFFSYRHAEQIYLYKSLGMYIDWE